MTHRSMSLYDRHISLHSTPSTKLYSYHGYQTNKRTRQVYDNWRRFYNIYYTNITPNKETIDIITKTDKNLVSSLWKHNIDKVRGDGVSLTRIIILHPVKRQLRTSVSYHYVLSVMMNIGGRREYYLGQRQLENWRWCQVSKFLGREFVPIVIPGL